MNIRMLLILFWFAVTAAGRQAPELKLLDEMQRGLTKMEDRTETLTTLPSDLFSTQDYELYGKCLVEPKICSQAMRFTENLRDSPLREELVLIILRSSPAFWGPDIEPLRAQLGPGVAITASACFTTLKKYFQTEIFDPNNEKSNKPFERETSRKALADRLEKQMPARERPWLTNLPKTRIAQ